MQPFARGNPDVPCGAKGGLNAGDHLVCRNRTSKSDVELETSARSRSLKHAKVDGRVSKVCIRDVNAQGRARQVAAEEPLELGHDMTPRPGHLRKLTDKLADGVLSTLGRGSMSRTAIGLEAHAARQIGHGFVRDDVCRHTAANLEP